MLVKRKIFGILGCLALVLSLGIAVASAQDEATGPLVLQDFEGEVALEDTYQAVASIGDVAQNGAGSLASTSEEGDWHTVGAELLNAPVDISGFDQLCFAVNDTTAAGNTVGVKLFDATGANTERWSDNEGVGSNPKTSANEWVTICMNLISYTGIDLTQISQIQFTMFAAGVYYFDDVVAQNFGDSPAVVIPMAKILTPVQGFEAEETYYSDYQAEVSLSDNAHSGASSLMASSAEGEWHAFGAYPETRPLDASGYEVLCFWINDTTANNNGLADNTVGVSLIDAAGTKVEVWTDSPDAGSNPKTVTGEWVQMCMNLSAYTGLDLTQIDKIQFALFWAGTYYIDDIAFGMLIPDPAANVEQTPVQGFEAEETYYSDYQAEVSLSDNAHSGASSLMATSAEGEWHAFGAYPETRPLDVSGYDAFCFWINDTTANNNGLADNTVGVSLIDAAGTKVEVWTDNADAGFNPKTVTGEWVQMCMNLSAYTGLDLSQIDKIQFALFWAGTYYIDDISFGTFIEEVAAPEATEEPALNLEFTPVQGFEAEETYYSDYQAEVSLSDNAHSGASSLMATSAEGEWHSFGAYPETRPLDVSGFHNMCFWINDTTTNNNGLADNTVGVSLIDAAGTKVEVWTDSPDAGSNTKTVTGEWVQMCMNLSAYTGLDLTQIDKIQFSLYWAGTYYIDDIEFGTVVP